GRPSDITKDLDDIFRAYALTGDKGNGAVRFTALNRLNMILAVAPNPGVFAEVEKWLAKLDVPAKVTAGSVDNYVYKLKYERAEILGGVINQLYGGCGFSSGLYGGMPGNSMYPATGYPGSNFGGGNVGFNGAPAYGGYGGGGYGGGAYGGGYGGASPYGASAYGTGYPGGGGYSGGGGFGAPCIPNSGGGIAGAFGGVTPTPFNSTPAAATASPGATTPAATTAAQQDQTGSYLNATASPYGRATGPRIIPNPFNNTLLVQGTPQEWEQIRRLIEQMDIPPRQVLIDAKIYEVNLTGDFSFGVETYLQSRSAANPPGIAGRQFTGSNTNGTSTSPGVFALSAGTLVGQSRQLLALLQAQESTTRAKVLSAPSVIATDSIPASITVGDSVPTLSSIAASNVQQNGNSLFTNTIQNTSTGIGLNILARINPSGVVTMVINQNVTAPTPTTTSNIDSPSFSQRNVSTQVTVEDGDTVAIGGIIEDTTNETSSGIPFLHRIPYLGAAFGTKSTNKTRTELIIFLTPRVIYDTTQMADASDELKQKVRDLKKMIRDE
ncbi:MAG TPA: secretin N-terminal domain-containing protein, partial [Bryobacteraceae bacterium]|nr:secretin N-terminal domain-containing protein [Bryobacteraceae bacterium]